MVNHLLALITPKRPPAVPPDTPKGDIERLQSSSIRSFTTRIGSLLTQAFHNNLVNHGHPSATATPLSRRISSAEITPSTNTSSPYLMKMRHRLVVQRWTQVVGVCLWRRWRSGGEEDQVPGVGNER